jgi:hypothetical protein
MANKNGQTTSQKKLREVSEGKCMSKFLYTNIICGCLGTSSDAERQEHHAVTGVHLKQALYLSITNTFMAFSHSVEFCIFLA